jgi:hypothetical protein
VADFNAVAKEVFQVLRSFNYTLHLYDENSQAVTEPEKARRMICHPKNLMVSLRDDDDNSRITLSIGRSTDINDVMGLNQKLRVLATKYNMLYSERNNTLTNINPKNFAELASIAEQKDSRMLVYEGMYGTSRSSYLRLENARMIVRHKTRIDDSKIGARGRCVETVFIENAAGERSLMPSTNLMAGRAMTQHVNQGGGFADPVAQQINELAMDYRNLHTGARAAITESAGMVREACRTKMGKLRKTFERLSRATSYATEAADLAATRTLLHETDQPVTDSRIDELRQLLNGEHSHEVYESCCKALDEMRSVTMTTVLGQPVAAGAWQAFWNNNQLDLSGQPTFAHRLKSKLDDLAYRLSEISSVVKDDGLSTLFNKVAERLPGETNEETRKIYYSIAMRALRAVTAKETFETRLASKNATIVEHMNWLNLFDPDRVLTEADLFDPALRGGGYDPMDPSFPDHEFETDAAMDSAVRDFDADAFIESPQMVDVIGGRDPHDPDENDLTKDEIMGALEGYLRDYIETNNAFSDGFDDETATLAEEVYDLAADALHQSGFVISTTGLAEESEELTIEDILLPKPNQGDDLAGEVMTTDVTDPDDPDHHEAPDERWTNRLLTLAGMRSGREYN